MTPGRAPAPLSRGHPARLPLRRCACSGQKAVCAAHSGPCAPAAALGPCLRFAPALASARRRSGLRRALADRVPLRLAGSAYRAGPRPPIGALPPPGGLAAPSAAASGGSGPGRSGVCSGRPRAAPGRAPPGPALPLRAPSAPLPGSPPPGPPFRARASPGCAALALSAPAPGPIAALWAAFLGPRPRGP